MHRNQLRQEWLLKYCPKYTTMTALPADASFRRYFRITTPEKKILLMDAPPEHENSHHYVAIAKAYRKEGIHTPEIYAEDLDHGFLLIEDFGDTLLNSALKNLDSQPLYQKSYELLPRIQSCQNIPNLELPRFVDKILATELENFRTWCVIKFAGLTLSTKEEYLLTQTFEFLKKCSAKQPQVGVHRDYHSRNLMLLETEQIGVIDFQDAVIGPITYDLVSLLRDCYIDWPIEQVYAWVKTYYENFGDKQKYSLEQFQEWFDLQGLQRHLKAIFIFCRKYLRDASTYYLDDIPRTLNYVQQVAHTYPELYNFHQFLENRLTQPLLEKINTLMSKAFSRF